MICIKRRNQVIIAVRNSGTDDELQQEHVGQQTQEPHQEVRKRNQSNERTMDAGFCFKKTDDYIAGVKQQWALKRACWSASWLKTKHNYVRTRPQSIGIAHTPWLSPVEDYHQAAFKGWKGCDHLQAILLEPRKQKKRTEGVRMQSFFSLWWIEQFFKECGLFSAFGSIFSSLSVTCTASAFIRPMAMHRRMMLARRGKNHFNQLAHGN